MEGVEIFLISPSGMAMQLKTPENGRRSRLVNGITGRQSIYESGSYLTQGFLGQQTNADLEGWQAFVVGEGTLEALRLEVHGTDM
jgi:hypothetical protein